MNSESSDLPGSSGGYRRDQTRRPTVPGAGTYRGSGPINDEATPSTQSSQSATPNHSNTLQNRQSSSPKAGQGTRTRGLVLQSDQPQDASPDVHDQRSKGSHYIPGSQGEPDASPTQPQNCPSNAIARQMSARYNQMKIRMPIAEAMTSHRSIDSAYMRDMLLVKGGFEEPTGRLTSVDPRYPTNCPKDEEVNAYQSCTSAQFQDPQVSYMSREPRRSYFSEDAMNTVLDQALCDDPGKYEEEREAMNHMLPTQLAQENALMRDFGLSSLPPVVTTRSAQLLGPPQDSRNYLEDMDDPVDKQLAHCLRTCQTQHLVQRKRDRCYEIDGREVTLDWEKRNRAAGEDSILIVIDGPLRQPCKDYLENTEDNAEYDSATLDVSIMSARREDRLSFRDENHNDYTRLEAMRVAKEQAKLRDASNSSDVDALAEHERLEQYRKWHKAQLSQEPPFIAPKGQVNAGTHAAAQVQRQAGEAIQGHPNPRAGGQGSADDAAAIMRDSTLLPGSAQPFGNPVGMAVPQFTVPNLFAKNNLSSVNPYLIQ